MGQFYGGFEQSGLGKGGVARFDAGWVFSIEGCT
jgi:hypothetical protein